jgi:putative hydrolase of the HAD superfamily
MNNKYSAVIFDLGNVLLSINYSKLLKKLDTYKKGLGNRFAALYKKNYDTFKTYERGQLSTEKFLETMMFYTENYITQEEFCEIFSCIFVENTKLTSLLPLLKKNYRLILLSNTNYIHHKYGWEKYSFITHFETLILSYQVGVMKPDYRIYEVVENYTKLPSSKHLFIDDLPENVEAAINLGWDGIQYNGIEKLEVEFKRRNMVI